jgi:hypothetical protein
MRSPYRTRRPVQIRSTRQPFGMGPQVTNGMTGLPIPRSLAVRQRGQWVNPKKSGELDKPQSW